MKEVLKDFKTNYDLESKMKTSGPTYASVAAANIPRVYVIRKPMLKTPASIAFIIIPNEVHQDKYNSSKAIR